MRMKMKAKRVKKPLTIVQKISRRNFISFAAFTVFGVSVFEGWRWLSNSPQEITGITAGRSVPLRRALNKTELFFRRVAFSDKHLVKTYPKSMAAKQVRVNSDIGVEAKNKFDPAAWKLQVIKKGGEVLQIGLDELRALPKTEIIYDFKCVEGWDQIQHWAGLRFVDFISHFGLEEFTKHAYVGMETPDKAYYVGIDMESILHPQTILAYELNEKPISQEHGAPLRLI